MLTHAKSTQKIRFRDCDLFGHLNNSSYIDYFLDAREDHLSNNYGMNLSELYKQDQAWVVGSHEIYYLRPAFYGEMVCLLSALVEVSQDRLIVEMIMTDEKMQQMKAITWSSFFSISIKTGTKKSHSQEFMDFASTTLLEDINYSDGINNRIKVLNRIIKR